MSKILIDGSMDWSGGVNSIKTTTVASSLTPNGLQRNELAWLINGTVRDGGITPRSSWRYLFTINDGTGKYQGGVMYEPTDGSDPYIVAVISGVVYLVDLIAGTVTAAPPAPPFVPTSPTIPTTIDRCHFQQAEEFLVIQAGDFVTLPLIWNGTYDNFLGQSTGLTPGGGGTPMIPAAGPMDYYMGRLWYARGRQWGAGDIVYGASGTAPYNSRDAVLYVVENPLCAGGYDFLLPGPDANIRAIKHTANINTQLGQGQIFAFTRRSICSMEVPISRYDWILAGNDGSDGSAPADRNTMPVQRVVQLRNGSVNDWGIVQVNEDLYYQSFEPGIRSLATAVRYFKQPGNVELSAPVDRLVRYNDRNLMQFCSGINFNNRLLMTQMPLQTDQGVVHQALISMDFLPSSTPAQNLPPVWEGSHEGLQFLQLFEGDFGGLPRAFAIARSSTGEMQVWELTTSYDVDYNKDGDNRVTMVIEWPAFDFSDPLSMKKLVSAEIWVDRMKGEVEFAAQYRTDGDHCWNLWHMWKKCSARDSSELIPPSAYPTTPYCENYSPRMNLPLPPNACSPSSKRPMNVGYQFQPRLVIKGNARVRGILLKAEKVDQALYDDIVC